MTSDIDIRKFYQATKPTQTLSIDSSEEDRKYYIDFSSVRGEKAIEDMKKKITFWSLDEPTCQLFTGHIGCGKSTELRRLKAELEEEDYHVVYFESDEDLEMGDVDVGDILLAIARRVDRSLENVQIKLNPTRFKKLLLDVEKVLNLEIKGFKLKTPSGIAGYEKKENEISISFLIGELTSKAKDSPKFRDQLRGYLEPLTNGILKVINTEL